MYKCTHICMYVFELDGLLRCLVLVGGLALSIKLPGQRIIFPATSELPAMRENQPPHFNWPHMLAIVFAFVSSEHRYIAELTDA